MTNGQLKFEIFEDERLKPIKGKKLSPVEEFTCQLLLKACKERPVTNQAIREILKGRFYQDFTERGIKDLILSLRESHVLPIAGSKEPPFGYWWINSPEEMKAQWERVRSENIKPLAVWSHIIKENFPELAGQLRLDYGEDDGQHSPKL